eukprot:15765664-Heterocapsa_arctica.AAC.1
MGRVPWVVGGDWNLLPGEFTIEGASSTAAYVEPGAPTCITGRTGSTIDWFMVSAGLANGAESMFENDAAVCKRKPVRLKIGGRFSDDMGTKIRRPVSLQEMTRKEAN